SESSPPIAAEKLCSARSTPASSGNSVGTPSRFGRDSTTSTNMIATLRELLAALKRKLRRGFQSPSPRSSARIARAAELPYERHGRGPDDRTHRKPAALARRAHQRTRRDHRAKTMELGAGASRKIA